MWQEAPSDLWRRSSKVCKTRKRPQPSPKVQGGSFWARGSGPFFKALVRPDSSCRSGIAPLMCGVVRIRHFSTLDSRRLDDAPTWETAADRPVMGVFTDAGRLAVGYRLLKVGGDLLERGYATATFLHRILGRRENGSWRRPRHRCPQSSRLPLGPVGGSGATS